MTRDVLTGSLVFVLVLARSFADGFGFSDESWFLQVAARLRAGETLYRDVFLGVTPLSAYATTALTLLTGVEIAAVKIATAACFAMTSVLTGRLARGAGLSTGASTAVVAAMFVWGRPYNSPPYTAMAVMFLVASMVSSLRATADAAAASRTGWARAGLWAGLAFVSKQNVGLLAFGCVLGALFVGAGSVRRRQAAMAAASGFVGLSILVLVPVFASGGAGDLWDYGFSGKGAYLHIGAVSYVESLSMLGTSAMHASSMERVAVASHMAVVLLPAAVAIMAVTAARRLDRIDWTLVLFSVAATLVAFPRWDRFHMAYAVPVHLVVMGRLGARTISGRVVPALRAGAGAALALTALLVAVQPLVDVARGDRRPSALPHFRGPLIDPDEEARLAADATRLASSSGGQPVFVTSTSAGFWYLVSGVANPTPFDMPARTATGMRGVERLLAGLARRDIELVCADDGPVHAQSLDEIDHFVRQHYVQALDVGPCTMYRAPTSDPGTSEGRR